MSWSSHHTRLKRTSAVFCQSLALPHGHRSRSGRRKKDSRTTRCNGGVGGGPLQISVFLYIVLPPPLPCSRKNLKVFTVKKKHPFVIPIVARVPNSCCRADT